MTKDTTKAARRAGSRFSIVRLSQCVLLADSWGFRPCSRPLGADVASLADAGVAPSLARARRDQCRGGGAAIAARATARAT